MDPPLQAIRLDLPSWLAGLDEDHPTAFKDHVRELRDARARSNGYSSLAEGYELLRSFEFKIPDTAHEDGLPRRQLPASVTAIGPHTLRLVSRLSSGHGLHTPGDTCPSQVWTVRTDSTRDDELLVAKIYCPSFAIPRTSHIPGIYEYITPTQHARVEEAAYKALSSVQGRWVPYFLGRFQTALPHGEPAEVNLLEYVPGQLLSEWRNARCADPLHTIGTLEFKALRQDHIDLFTGLSTQIAEMHALGIRHCNLHGSHIILPQPDRLSGGFVFIDFAYARAWKPPTERSNVGVVDYRKAAAAFRCCDAP
ncbi:unnamed protein product [Peniophora sp. CBMAI 1063]|nr:unnamed protein product [Peniophora sp. CBMAI 1063]